jgi:hypothetical protein
VGGGGCTHTAHSRAARGHAVVSYIPAVNTTIAFSSSLSPAELSEWALNGEALAAALFGNTDDGGNGPRPLDHLTGTERARVFHYYLPVYEWIRAQVAAAWRQQQFSSVSPSSSLSLPSSSSSPSQAETVVVGLSCVQGGGKTTLVNALQQLMATTTPRMRMRCVAVSIDDFYLTRGDQEALAQRHVGNKLLQVGE